MNPLPGGGAPAAPGAGGRPDPNDPNVKMMNQMMESCFGKSVISGTMGFAMGGVFGLFMASMSYDTPFHGAAGAPGSAGAAASTASIPMRQQLAHGFKDMGQRSWSSARNFGKVGLLFSGIECGIEGFRAKNDLANGTAAGCLTGGILARSGGPTAVVGGCAAFAAFSAAIDAYMRQPAEE